MESQISAKAIVFDCFGVVYDDAFKIFLQTYAEKLDRPIQEYYSMARANDFGQLTDKEYYAELSALSGEQPEAIRKRMHDTSSLNPQVVEIIKNLKNVGHQVGMLTNANSAFLREFLDYHQIWELFDQVVASSDVGYVKPQPEFFAAAAQQLGREYADMIFVDDRERNTIAAADLGIPVILYKDPAQLQTELAHLIKTS